MQLSKHFTLHELIRSDYAVAHHIDNTPSVEVTQHLSKLVTVILEPMRTALNHSVRVSSGYRCTQLNHAVGGVSNSNHLLGYAADIPFARDVWLWLTKHRYLCNELLDEHKRSSHWIHVSVKP